jgi:hypothetical protein
MKGGLIGGESSNSIGKKKGKKGKLRQKKQPPNARIPGTNSPAASRQQRPVGIA